MKNKIILTLRTIILATVLAACGNNDKIDGIDTPANNAVIRAGIDNGLSRSGDITVPDGHRLRHVIEVWTTGDGPVMIHREERVTTGSEAVVFIFKLTDEGNYKTLLWADFVKSRAEPQSGELNGIAYSHYPDNHYTTTDGLNSVAIAHAGSDYTVNDDTRDAFFAAVDIVKDTEAYSENVTLKRPFGQLNIIEKNTGTLADLASMTLVYDVPGSFDVETGTPGATVAVNPIVTTLPVPSAVRQANLFYDYIFAPDPDAQTTLGQIAMTFESSGSDYKDFTLPALVPIARNRRTNVSGSILYNTDASISITVSDSWDNTTTDMNLVFIPDPAFRQFCIDNGYADAGGCLLPDKAAAATGLLDVSNMGISSLAGIEYFTNITGLYCSNNLLTELNVKANTQLTRLDCYFNQLTELDISKNTQLTTLDCTVNKLAKLDVSENTQLTKLECNNNQLTELDVSENTLLTELECNNNRISELDASKMSQKASGKWYLYCGRQTTDGNTMLQLQLKLRDDQKAFWSSDLENMPPNSNVTVVDN